MTFLKMQWCGVDAVSRTMSDQFRREEEFVPAVVTRSGILGYYSFEFELILRVLYRLAARAYVGRTAPHATPSITPTRHVRATQRDICSSSHAAHEGPGLAIGQSGGSPDRFTGHSLPHT